MSPECRKEVLGETLIENAAIHRLTFVPLEALYRLVSPPEASDTVLYDGPRKDAAHSWKEGGGGRTAD